MGVKGGRSQSSWCQEKDEAVLTAVWKELQLSVCVFLLRFPLCLVSNKSCITLGFNNVLTHGEVGTVWSFFFSFFVLEDPNQANLGRVFF